MINYEKLKSVCDIFQNKDDFVIITHDNLDGDAISSSLAVFCILKKLNKKCVIAYESKIPQNFNFLIDDYFLKEKPYVLFDCEEFDIKDKYVVSVDLADKKLLGKFLQNIEKIDLCIDHHRTNKIFAEISSLVNPLAASTTEIIYEIAKFLKLIDIQIAEYIYVGIITDTGRFAYPNVTEKTHKIASDLIKIGVRNDTLNYKIFDCITKNQIFLNQLVLQTLEFFLNSKCAMIFINQSMLSKSNTSKEDIGLFTQIPRQIKGVLVGATIKEEKKNVYKVSIRTKVGVSAEDICKKFGGGGHKNAAGFTVKGDLNQIKQNLLCEISAVL
ncbi:MAG: bifunctional oligoribonuclease/PAP phosphatase NrnA [Oscillospiraceae bacterium]|jgi:phosphoesterase RecJ-like protein|nr:bifunctional oligoribonuclease/PAP phosphatase NrnA [Oscillospiraceae bacterium]